MSEVSQPTTSFHPAIPCLVPTRLPWLDVVRGSAVLLILFRHMGLPKPGVAASDLYSAMYTLQFIGWIGVDIFFVLSGFLVSGILFRQFLQFGQIRPWQFLIRRGFKIYPAFWLMIFVSVMFAWLGRQPFPTGKVLVELLFLQNYFDGLWVHTWSLGVEEHCYIILCCLVAVLAKRNCGTDNPFTSIPVIAIVVAVATLGLRIVNQVEVASNVLRETSFPTHLRCDTFFAGVLLAYYYHFASDQFRTLSERFRWPCLLIGIACFVPVFFWNVEADPIAWTWLFTSNAIGASLIIIWAVGTQPPVGRGLGLLANLGTYSYSIYLWHVMIGVKVFGVIFLKYQIPGGWLGFIGLYFAISIASGMMMSYLVERPALYWRDRLCPNDDRTVRTSSVGRTDRVSVTAYVAQCDPTMTP